MSKKELVILIIALGLAGALALRPSIRGIDGAGHYVYLSSILRDGDFDFANDYRRFDELKRHPFRVARLCPPDPRTGLPENRYGIGAALLWAPFVAATHGYLKLADPARATLFSRPYEWAVGLATAFWGSLALGLLYARLRRDWPVSAAAGTLAALVLATPLGFYLYAHGSMSHGVSFFAATGALLAFEETWRRPTPRLAAWCGFWSGLLVMIRPQDATWLAALGAALVYRCGTGILARDEFGRPAFRRNLKVEDRLKAGHPNKIITGKDARATLLAFPLAALLIFLPQMAVWRMLYGSWLSGPAPYLNASAGHFNLWPRHLVGVLFGERHGVLAWHPALALALAGLVVLWKREPAWRPLAAVALAGFAAQLWLVASWSVWWAGASFGNRFFISALPFLAPGLAVWPAHARRRAGRLVFWGALGLLIVWNAGLLIQYATELTPRETWIPWSQVIRQNLVDVPVLMLRKLKGG